MERPSPQHWPDIEQVLDRALELEPQDRAAFLDRACRGNPALRAEVERLLSAAERADSFLAMPAPAYAAPLVDRLAKAEALPPGTRLGGYEIERELGHGGMATVWLAEDVRHHRHVAIKVLHPELSAVLGSERFLKEIELTANLQHPHILPLFDSGEAGGLLYYVMPYVEGETLRGRLARERQLPVADAVRIATHVADALGYAHRHGVIHRDIKPENILLHDGRPVVADFGIALAVQQAGGERMTQSGLSLGTPQYMAPEQATGERVVDHRADLFALGAVTYEMLAGEPPFTGPTAQAVVSRLLTEEPPPLARRRRSIPSHIEAAVMTALEKLPADRFASAADFAAALSDGTRTVAVTPRRTVAGRAAAPWRRALPAAALFLAGALVAALLTPRGGAPARQKPAWLEIVLPSGLAEMGGEDLLLSPDGSRYLFARGRTGAAATRLVVRGIADTTETVLEGTGGVQAAIWSPDSRSIAFIRGGPAGPRTLLVVPVDGRPPTEVVDSVSGLGAWFPSDTIVFTRDGSLMAISVRGGVPRLVRAWDSTSGGGFRRFRTPAPLPGRRVLVSVQRPSTDEFSIGTVSLDDGELRILGPGWGARYVRGSYLLLAQSDGRVLGARFDSLTGTLSGPLRTVLTGLELSGNGVPELSVADDGTLLFKGGLSGGMLVAVDRHGAEHELTNEARNYNDVAVSPDGRWVATEINGVLWALDLRRRTLNRLTTGSGSEHTGGFVGRGLFPAYSPDGRSVVYVAAPDTLGLLAGEGRETSMLAVGPGWAGSTWSPDGRSLVATVNPGDLHIVDLQSKKSTDFVASRFVEQAPSFSPDGRWVAYASDESGRMEVYVRRFPAGGRFRISVDGGSEPAWSRGGGEIFFRSENGFMTATVRAREEIAVSRIERLFDDRHYQLSQRHREYALLPGDTTFVFIRTSGLGRLFVRFGWAARLDSLLQGT